MATWATTKEQAAELLGLQLTDKDVLDVPMLAADPYGKFIPGRPRPAAVRHRRPAWSRATPTAPVPVPANVLHFDTPFLTDIAHNADPSPAGHRPQPGHPAGGADAGRGQHASADFATPAAGTYDDEMLDAHFIAGDGRVNENIGLTAIHQVFHSEHDRLVADIKNVLDQRHLGQAAWPRSPSGSSAAGADGLERRAPLPGGPVRHRDGVPAPGLRGVRPQDPAGDQPLRAVRLHPDGPQPGGQGRVRPRRLPLRPLHADRDDLPHATRDGDATTTSRCSTAS